MNGMMGWEWKLSQTGNVVVLMMEAVEFVLSQMRVIGKENQAHEY